VIFFTSVGFIVFSDVKLRKTGDKRQAQQRQSKICDRIEILLAKQSV